MRKLLALLLVIFLVFPLILATLSVLSISSWVLDRNFYTNLLDDTRLYEVLLSEDLPNYFGRRVVPEADDLPVHALGNALREIATPEYLRSQALRIVDDAFDFVEGSDPMLDLYLDVAPLKAALRGEATTRFARALAAGLPACAAGQESVASGASLMRCLPADVSVDEATQRIVAGLPEFLDRVPDRINLNPEPIDLRRELRGVDFWTGLTASNGLSAAIAFLVFFAGSLWLAAALIGGVNRRERLQWLGWSLLAPAALIFLIGMAISADVSLGWVRFGLSEARLEGFEYSLAFQQALLDVSRDALKTVANGFLATGAAAGAIALALMVWGLATPPERRYAPVMAPAPMATPPVASPQPAPQPQPPAQTQNEPPGES